MSDSSGPAAAGTKPGSRAALLARMQERTDQTTAQLEQEQIEAMQRFGSKLMNAAADGMRTTKSAFLDETQQLQREIRSTRTLFRGLLWTPVIVAAVAVVLLISATLMWSWLTISQANQAPGPTQTFTQNGQTWEVLTGPGWTRCPYDGKTRPCRPIKE